MFGDKLKEIRKKKGITQKKLAEMPGISYYSVTCITLIT